MKSILVKALIPATLALGALSAHAADVHVLNVDYPAGVVSTQVAPAAAQGTGYSTLHNQAAPMDTQVKQSTRTREEVRREAKEPRAPFIGYFA